MRPSPSVGCEVSNYTNKISAAAPGGQSKCVPKLIEHGLVGEQTVYPDDNGQGKQSESPRVMAGDDAHIKAPASPATP